MKLGGRWHERVRGIDAARRARVGAASGADWASARATVGLAVGHSRGAGTYSAPSGIRPPEVARSPESLSGAVGPDAVRLYALIRDRMLASQMAAARSERLEILLATSVGLAEHRVFLLQGIGQLQGR